MFSKTIIDSDAFLDMPLSTQALYFHLSMRADDDGFLNNPRKIMRMIGSSDDELKVLLMKRFILSFETGVIVIKHWHIHNYIRNDRYKPTNYQRELSRLEKTDNEGYKEKKEEQLQLGIPLGIPNGNPDKDRLGKDSIDKINISFDVFWNLYDKKVGDKNKIESKWNKLSNNNRILIIDYIPKYKESQPDKKYRKNPETFLNNKSWNDEIINTNENNRTGNQLSDKQRSQAADKKTYSTKFN